MKYVEGSSLSSTEGHKYGDMLTISPQFRPRSTNRGGFTVDVPQEDYDKIAALISSDTSPVGIDAKKTHVIILHKLMQIEKRLAMLEQQAEA